MSWWQVSRSVPICPFSSYPSLLALERPRTFKAIRATRNKSTGNRIQTGNNAVKYLKPFFKNNASSRSPVYKIQVAWVCVWAWVDSGLCSLHYLWKLEISEIMLVLCEVWEQLPRQLGLHLQLKFVFKLLILGPTEVGIAPETICSRPEWDNTVTITKV